MIYTKSKYPSSFSVLPPDVRNKAINIANVLLSGGYDKKTADNIALANARYSLCSNNRRTMAHIAASVIHIVPHPEGWGLITTDALRTFAVYPDKKTALEKLIKFVNSINCKLIIHDSRGAVEDVRPLYKTYRNKSRATRVAEPGEMLS